MLPAIINIFVPGLGQLLQGRILAALLFFVSIVACTLTVIGIPIAVLLILWCIYDAARYERKQQGK